MAKRAISVTLSEDSIVWLRAKTIERKSTSLSETLDQLVTAARGKRECRSVVGTLEICDDDPLLERADEALRALFPTAGAHQAKRAKP
jgi:hypothetical protein